MQKSIYYSKKGMRLMNLPTLADVQTARETLRGMARETDLLPTSSSVFGAWPVYLKAENLQRAGSFKVRGAYNRIAALSPGERARGVICASAGNHAQGVALAAGLLGIKATIVMPDGAPLSKQEATRAYGGEVVLHGGNFDEALAHALEIGKDACFIHAFDDPLVIAGQGTVGLEILEQLPDCDTIVVPVGGGGLIAGIGLAVKTLRPEIKVIGVEPEKAASMHKSREAGHILALEGVRSLADGVAVGQPGRLTYELCTRYVDEVVTVTEREIAMAMLILLERMKLMAEGAGAVALAAALTGKIEKRGKTVVILSGGNVDVNILEQALDLGLREAGRRMTLSTLLQDRPGKLARLLDTVADLGANVLTVEQDRAALDAAPGQVKVTLCLETRDRAHIEAIRAAVNS